MSTPNAELAYKVLDYIDAHPAEWHQRSWVCGSAACFAGWAVRLSGCVIAQKYPDDPDSAYVTDGPQGIVGQQVGDAAEYVLGMRRYKDGRDDLFDAWNTREDLGRITAEIFGPRPDGGV